MYCVCTAIGARTYVLCVYSYRGQDICIVCVQLQPYSNVGQEMCINGVGVGVCTATAMPRSAATKDGR